jgi:endonuclease-3
MPRKTEAKDQTTIPPVPREKVEAIITALEAHYPDATCTLDYKNPLQLLVATILSAQCTDERVNQVTPSLFKKYPSAKDYATAPLEELETDIKSTGFYRNKAKSIQGCCRAIHEQYGGQVPANLDTLVKLPGIGRKTANVVLGNAFQIPGIVVDTHVLRVSQRLGLTPNKEPEKIERDLMAIIPRERWVKFCHQMILLGRQVCQARKPKMSVCPLRSYCDYAKSHAE